MPRQRTNRPRRKQSAANDPSRRSAHRAATYRRRSGRETLAVAVSPATREGAALRKSREPRSWERNFSCRDFVRLTSRSTIAGSIRSGMGLHRWCEKYLDSGHHLPANGRWRWTKKARPNDWLSCFSGHRHPVPAQSVVDRAAGLGDRGEFTGQAVFPRPPGFEAR